MEMVWILLAVVVGGAILGIFGSFLFVIITGIFNLIVGAVYYIFYIIIFLLKIIFSIITFPFKLIFD